MKNLFKSLVVIIVMAMLVFAVVSCDSSASDDNPSNASLEGTWYLREPSDPQSNYAMLKFTGRNLTVGTMLGGVYLEYPGTFTLTDTEINYTFSGIGSGTTTYTLSGITLWINDMEGLGGTFTRDRNEVSDSSDYTNDETNFSYHDNNVKVETRPVSGFGNLFDNDKDLGWTITGGYFEMSTYNVTQGQDPENRLWKKSYSMDKNHQFTFQFGRKASKDVAASFNKACPPEHNTFNHTAGELNFWAKGTMVLTFRNGETYVFSNTYFAQGHSGATNNWWFGNDAMINGSRVFYAYDPYKPELPPIYLGDLGYGYISPDEDNNLLFMFVRGDGSGWGEKYGVFLVGVYSRKQMKW